MSNTVTIPVTNNVTITAGSLLEAYRTALECFVTFVTDEHGTPRERYVDTDAFRTWALQEVERRRSDAEKLYARPVYAVKAAEAVKVLSRQPSPLLQTEAYARGMDVETLALSVQQKNTQAQSVLGEMEAWAYRARQAIQNAPDAETIIQILATEDWRKIDEVKAEPIGIGGTIPSQTDGTKDVNSDSVSSELGSKAGT